MDLFATLGVLETATSLISNGLAIYDWLKERVGTSSVPTELTHTLKALPSDASPEQIAKVIEPFFLGKGGDAELFAGSNNGGDTSVEFLDLAAGDGPAGGGTARVGGGQGGTDGKGGALKIGRAVIRGGNAK